jgi:hypothetical protein
MHSKFQARRISKQRIEFLRKSRRMKDAMVLGTPSAAISLWNRLAATSGMGTSSKPPRRISN